MNLPTFQRNLQAFSTGYAAGGSGFPENVTFRLYWTALLDRRLEFILSSDEYYTLMSLSCVIGRCPRPCHSRLFVDIVIVVILDDIKTKQLQWYGHVQRMEERGGGGWGGVGVTKRNYEIQPTRKKKTR